MTKSTHSPSPTRRRRSAAVAQQEILDAAQRLLSQGGPDAIRLQDIALDVGISHPTILHHFGSRDGLIRALDARAIHGLTGDVARILRSESDFRSEELVNRLAQTMDQQGLARLIALWAMRGSKAGSVEDLDPSALVESVSGLIRDQIDAPDTTEGDLTEAISFRVRLAVFAMFGEALIGDVLSPVHTDDRDAERQRFRHWLAELLVDGSSTEVESSPSEYRDE
jgi:AcrR family transcriptional regulator